MLGYSCFAAFVTLGIASVIPYVRNVIGCKISYVSTIGVVTFCIAAVVVIVRSDSCILTSIALCIAIVIVKMESFRGLCTLKTAVLTVGIAVTKIKVFCFSGFTADAAFRTALVFVAVSGGVSLISASLYATEFLTVKIKYVLSASGHSAVVTIGIASVFVVMLDYSYFTANVTGGIAGVISVIDMTYVSGRAASIAQSIAVAFPSVKRSSDFITDVTFCIAVVIISVLGYSCFTAIVTLGIAIVIPVVLTRGSSGSAANAAKVIAIACPVVRNILFGGVSYKSAVVAVRIASIFKVVCIGERNSFKFLANVTYCIAITGIFVRCYSFCTALTNGIASIFVSVRNYASTCVTVGSKAYSVTALAVFIVTKVVNNLSFFSALVTSLVTAIVVFVVGKSYVITIFIAAYRLTVAVEIVGGDSCRSANTKSIAVVFPIVRSFTEFTANLTV